VEEFAQCSFAALPTGVQNIVLLMRALVDFLPLVLLDEAWAGMDMCVASLKYYGHI
jgi:ABC-type molybdenum transport system ATPase subunit/photorepair protein PhrA